MQSRSVFLADATATQALGLELAQQWLALPAEARPILLLQGDLGAGKTCLVQGLAAGLGIDEPITSPTFALSHHYPQGQPPLVHLDLYRLELAAAADELFLQEEDEARALGALLVVEWPERLSLVLADAWRLALNHRQEGGRQAQLRDPTIQPDPQTEADTGA